VKDFTFELINKYQKSLFYEQVIIIVIFDKKIVPIRYRKIRR